MAKNVAARMSKKLVVTNLFDKIGNGRDERADNSAACLHDIADDRTCNKCAANACTGGGDCGCGEKESRRLALFDRGGP